MASHGKHLSRFGAAVAACVCAISLAAQTALALDISFRTQVAYELGNIEIWLHGSYHVISHMMSQEKT